jgi:NAD(P)H-hydrate epimerase
VFELLTAEQMQQADALAIKQGAGSFTLMQSAAAAVVSVVKRYLPPAGHVTLVAGPGNNGGDGAVAARLLAEDGYRVELVRFGRDEPVRADARRAFAEWPGPTLVVDNNKGKSLPVAVRNAIAHADIVVDALLGAGLGRDLSGTVAALVAAMNAANGRVVAIDLPSGIDGNTSLVRGAAVQADHTVTFVRYKPAHFLYPGKAHCGQLELAQIGMDAQVLDALHTPSELNHPALWRGGLPVPTTTGHKFDRGHVLVRGGDVSHTGAGRLSAGAALQCGAGLVTLATPQDALAVNAAHLTAVMLTRCDSEVDWQQTLLDQHMTAAVLGPANGVNETTRQCVEVTLDENIPCVLDADALTSFAHCPRRLFTRLLEYSGSAVLTPHEGEFSRLFGEAAMAALPSKLHRALRAAELSGAVVVLKGPDTVIATPAGRARINNNAPPWLATAGSGDVLAGVIAALLAQGMDSFNAACAGVWLHADAANRLSYPMTAEQLILSVGSALGACNPLEAPLPPLGL